MVNSNLSFYEIKSEDMDTTNLDTDYTRVKFYRQFNFVVCEFLITTVDYANTADHTVIFDGKIPSAFRPINTFKQDVTDYYGALRHGLITINTEGGMKFAMGASNTHMRVYGSLVYPAKVIDPEEEIYFFILSAPSEVQYGDTYTVSVLVKNSENNPLSKNVLLKKSGESIGTFQTDATGVASTTLTATGEGLFDIVAECEQSVSQLNIIDAYLYDIGTDPLNPSTKWNNYLNRMNVEITEDGTSITTTSSSTGYYCVNKDEQTITSSTINNLNQFDTFVMEFDVVSTTNFGIYIRGSSEVYSKNYTASNVQDVERIKVEVTSTELNYYFDGVLQSTTTRTGSQLLRVCFSVASSKNLVFKNFILYPIEEEVLDGQ